MSPEDLGSALASLLALPERLDAIERRLDQLARSVETVRSALPPSLAAVPDAAEALGVSESTVRRRIREGRLPIVRVGRCVRVDLAALSPADEEEVAQLAFKARNGSWPE